MDPSQPTYPPLPEGTHWLFENCDKPFAGDTFMEQEFLKLKKQFRLDAAIETGTCYGSTTLWLLSHFEHVHSCEVNVKYYEVADHRITKNFGRSIGLWLGTSPLFLTQLLPAAKEQRPIIFLDAHWEQYCPLLDELAAIAEVGIKPVIAIHDFQVPDRPDLGYDTWNGQPLRFSYIRPSLERIYDVNGYSHHYNSEAIGAKRGVIYVYPS
jgi:hypothetical protein